MAAKKAVNLSKLPFNELRDKAKEIEGFKSLNRFELLQAVAKAGNQAGAADPAKVNPRQVKPEITRLKAQLAETPKEDKKARKQLRQAVAKLKRSTRQYL